jgi:hypothetical protein
MTLERPRMPKIIPIIFGIGERGSGLIEIMGSKTLDTLSPSFTQVML